MDSLYFDSLEQTSVGLHLFDVKLMEHEDRPPVHTVLHVYTHALIAGHLRASTVFVWTPFECQNVCRDTKSREMSDYLEFSYNVSKWSTGTN